jgi:hypothetical protein
MFSRFQLANTLLVGCISTFLGSFSAFAFGGGTPAAFNIDASYAETQKVDLVFANAGPFPICASYNAKISGRTNASKVAFYAKVQATMYFPQGAYGVPAKNDLYNSNYAYAYTTAKRFNALCVEQLEARTEHRAKETSISTTELYVARNSILR